MNRLFRQLCNLASQYFPFWVLLAALLGLKNPDTFLLVLPHIPLLLGVIMLGMGMTLQVEDLREVLRRPKLISLAHCWRLIGVLEKRPIHNCQVNLP